MTMLAMQFERQVLILVNRLRLGVGQKVCRLIQLPIMG